MREIHVPGYAYLIEHRDETGTWQKVGVAADKRRLRQHRGWEATASTVQVAGYRLADPRTDVEGPVLKVVGAAGRGCPTSGNPKCPDCGAPMPILPAQGHTEAWHVDCRGDHAVLFNRLLAEARRKNPYPDWSRPRFVDGELDAHSMTSRNGRFAHVAEYPQVPNRTPGTDAARHTMFVANAFYVRFVPAGVVLSRLSDAAMVEVSLTRFLLKEFPEDMRLPGDRPMRKASGSGFDEVRDARRYLNEMADEPAATVAFINDRTEGILHAFAEPSSVGGDPD